MTSTSTPTDRPRRTVTSRDLARRAGVSQSTVSLVLNGKAADLRISPRTQKRILDAAHKLGYQSNYLARGLRGASTQSVAIVWSLVSTPHGAALVSDLAKRIGDEGYVSYVADLVRDHDKTLATLRDLRQRRVDAVVLHTTYHMFDDGRMVEELSSFPAAVVISDQAHDIPFDLVVHDRLGAYRQAADHFADTGRRRPAIVANLASNQAKVRAFSERLQERGLAGEQCMAIDVPVRGDKVLAEDCFAALERNAPQCTQADAFMCGNDELAIVTMAWLRQRGLRAGRDAAVVGFDNTQTAAFADPPLASVERYDGKVAAMIKQMLFKRMADPHRPPQRRQIDMKLVWRASAGGEPTPPQPGRI